VVKNCGIEERKVLEYTRESAARDAADRWASRPRGGTG
jgi:hypothetical protein